MNLDLLDAAKNLEPIPLQEFLRSRGWHMIEDLSQDRRAIVIYQRGDFVVEVPQRTDYGDYPRRVVEVLGILADAEKMRPTTIIDELTQPAGDTLSFRLQSESTDTGTIPILDSLRIRTASKNLLLAAAHSVLSPEPYFPRMSRADAVELVRAVREGQSQRGSFVARFIVPLEPAVGKQSDVEPFARRVVCLLITALDDVRRVRALGEYDELLEKHTRGVSGNLLAALGAMHMETGELDVSVSWARNRQIPRECVRRVTFPADSLRGLHSVANAMRDQSRSSGFELAGHVTRLDRDTADGSGPGEVVVVPRLEDDEEIGRVHVALTVEAYQRAILAHGSGSPVRVFGTLAKQGRKWVLDDPSGFELLPTDPDESIAAVVGKR